MSTEHRHSLAGRGLFLPCCGVSSDAVAKGMGPAGKPKGMNGAAAPVLWAEGWREEVLQYVGQDVRTTLDLATTCEAGGKLRWIARSGNVRGLDLPEGVADGGGSS